MAERKYAHGYVQTARGALVDADGPLARALDAVKDVEEERDRYRAALEHIVYVGWPGAAEVAAWNLREGGT